ncbi:fibrinogen-like protein 1 isoform X7 [Drosophila sulfurigaster albostrigata]|uniref:fibrinogen-like protein 1 isoform X5 n=1 Tax=Drosophila sulfurigaster albostrigata TaxID=89887 RepID=UPI002D218DC2|nr:fibrinogen-like protein 1 isoform X5 [Drosophila sulfurigaster albostrigata]XP_062121226.1 fibrinogen-like protein 1 isoform X6 [Drosophila sulfurigaster albostrigata]XP_062121227.1 fibrinogen-like protein 1 isoform X7 [Drosophila sulfurigaster albostrigata]
MKRMNQTKKTVKPLLDIIRQLRNKLEQSETKEKQISELNSDLMEKYHEIVRIHETFIKEADLLNEYKNKVIKGENDLQLCQNKVDKSESEINSQQNIILKLKEQLTDKSTNLESCEVQLISVNSKLIQKDENIKIFSENIKNNTEHQKTLELELEKSKSILIKHEKDIQLCRSEINQLNTTSENIREEQKKYQLKLTENETKLSQSELDKLTPTTCISFGDYSGVNQLNVSGIGLFNVLCDSQLAGPGWIVIQQRVGGNESFNRDWATYRKGFGSFESDFFLGLEKLHRITSLQRFELYIHMIDGNGNTYNARYDDFKISDEDNGYVLSLGKFNGTIYDGMRYNENMKFSTFDHDNDKNDYDNCAAYFKSGWWYKSCSYCNLNAPYGPLLRWWDKSYKYIFNLKEVKMLIRPKKR